MNSTHKQTPTTKTITTTVPTTTTHEPSTITTTTSKPATTIIYKLFKDPIFKPFTVASNSMEEDKSRLSKFKKSSPSLLRRKKTKINKKKATFAKLRRGMLENDIMKDKMEDMMENMAEVKKDMMQVETDSKEDKMEVKKDMMQVKTDSKEDMIGDKMEVKKDMVEAKMEDNMKVKKEMMEDLKTDSPLKYIFTDIYEPNWENFFN